MSTCESLLSAAATIYVALRAEQQARPIPTTGEAARVREEDRKQLPARAVGIARDLLLEINKPQEATDEEVEDIVRGFDP